MVLLYSADWKKIPYTNKYTKNVVKIQITFLDEWGKTSLVDKLYEEWMGVCTGDIQKVVRDIHQHFPGENVRYERYDDKLYKKVLPYFAERLRTGKLAYSKKPFYKIYTVSPIYDIGRFFSDKRKFTFYHKDDWMVRLSIDLCRENIYHFRYQWYDVKIEERWLLLGLQLMPDYDAMPRWKVAAFDLETITPYSSRVPTGSDPEDRVVMISVITWHTDSPEIKKEHVLYLNPCETESLGFIDSRYIEYDDETKLINDFHALIDDAHILTGYNVNGYDIPFLFARLMWLNMRYIFIWYNSRTVGNSIITTYKDKLVLDVMDFIELQTRYDGSSMKLDVVAKHILDENKVDLDPVGIHAWYVTPQSKELYLSEDPALCQHVFQKRERFGTFLKYLEYCLVDSTLVYKLFLKEGIFSAMLMRANSVSLDMVQAIHIGNSRMVLEYLKTIGLKLGFFINVYHLKNNSDQSKFLSVLIKGKYQGALNFCLPQRVFTNVSNLDFTSMYPSVILSSNLCYSNSDILPREECIKHLGKFTIIAYRNHTDKDFEEYDGIYPLFDPERDEFGIVINSDEKACLPTLVEFLMERRKYHQRRYKEMGNVMDHNAQGSMKLLANSLYGTLGSKDSPVGCVTIAMTITALSRCQLLGANQYVKKNDYLVCYADTDSLMVQDWPVDNCDAINRFLNLPHVELKFENRMRSILILSKKRYVYETEKGEKVSKGFQKKMNELVQSMSDDIIDAVMALRGEKGDPSEGWILWVKTLTKGEYMCRNPKKYYIHRKTKEMDEYKSKSCTTMRYLSKYPEKSGQHIEFAYCRADVSADMASKWIVDTNETNYVNFEKLFVSQTKNLTSMLNIGFWQKPNPEELASMVLNTMRWKKFVHVELLHYFKTGKRVRIFVEKGIKYTFKVNDYTTIVGTRKRKREPQEHI